VDDQVVPRGTQMACHGRAHDAETDEADVELVCHIREYSYVKRKGGVPQSVRQVAGQRR
jgi:hypothetical protein